MSETIVLSCPNCDTRFLAPADKFIPNGRQVRCSNCRHTWFYGSAEAQAYRDKAEATSASPPGTGRGGDAGDTGADQSTIRQTIIENRKRDRSINWFNAFFWVVALCLLAAILAYLFRDPLGRAIPAIKPALERYAGTIDTTAQRLAGQEEAVPTLTLTGVRYDLKEYDGERAMLVEADLENRTEAAVDAPRLRVRIVDEEKKPIHETFVNPEDLSKTIDAGLSTRYFIRIPEPPADFESVLVEIEK